LEEKESLINQQILALAPSLEGQKHKVEEADVMDVLSRFLDERPTIQQLISRGILPEGLN